MKTAAEHAAECERLLEAPGIPERVALAHVHALMARYRQQEEKEKAYG